MFENRQHAGRLLANRLQNVFDDAPAEPTVVIALPRGGIPVGAEIALALHCPLDFLVSKKIHAPDNPELAIGAVSSDGVVVMDEDRRHFWLQWKGVWDTQQEQRERLIIQTRQMEDYWAGAAGMPERVSVAGRRVIVVDDGIATGMTTLAALKTLQQRGAGQIILSAPVIPQDTYERLRTECDLLVTITIPYEFASVSFYYADFHQIEDDEVIEILARVAQSQKAFMGNPEA